MMIIEFLGTLNQPYTTRMDGRYRSRSRWKREPDILWCSRESISAGIVPLLLQCPNPSRQLAPYGHILRDKLSHSRSKKKMMNIQARPLRVSAASEELHIAATRKTHTLVLERESMCVRIAVLLLRCSDPSRQLASYGDILRDKLSFIISSSNKMTQLQPQARSRYSLRVSDGAADDSSCGCRQSIIESEAALSTYCILLEVDQTRRRRRRRIASIASLAKA